MGFFVDRQHHGVFRRLQIQPNHVGRFLGKARIGADAPAAASRQRDLVPPQHAPDLMFGDAAEVLRQQIAIPAAVAFRRRLIQRGQKAFLVGALVIPRLAAARRIRQTRQNGPGQTGRAIC